MTRWDTTLRMALVGAGFAVALTTAPHTALAQDGGQPEWIKMCNTDPAVNKELCLVIQELRADTGQFIASATLRQYTGEDDMSLIAAVPPGMLIQPGMRVQIDGGTQHEVAYGICYPNACYGELKISDGFINEMKAGGQLVISALNQGEKVVSFPLTLVGFTKTYDGEGLDPAGAEARQNELNAALQQRAAEARRRLIEQQQQGNN